MLGAINPKDGAVIWRQRLADSVQGNHTTSNLLKAGEGGDTLISAVNGKIQAWDATDGRLVWEWDGGDETQVVDVTPSAEGGKYVLVLSVGQGSTFVARSLAADTGEVFWESGDSSGDAPYAVLSSQDRIFTVSLHSALLKGLKIRVAELGPSDGKFIAQSISLNSDSDLISEASILHIGANSGQPFLIWTDKALKTLKVNKIGTKQITTLNVPSSNGESAEKIIVHAPRSPTAHPHFLVHYQGADSHWAEVFHVDTDTKKAYDLPRLGGKGAFSTSSQGSDVYFTRHTAFENILVSSIGPSVLSHWDVRPKSHGGMVDPQDISHAASEVVSRGGSTYAVRSALTLPSGDWELIRNGDPYWVRSEGLTGAVAAAFVEIPKEENLDEVLAAESHRGIIAAYVHRVKRHARDLQRFPSWAQALPARVLGSFLGDKAGSQDQSLRQDGFGFHKIVIVATEHGRLAALDAGTQGKVIWNIQAVNLKAGEKWHVLGIEGEKNTAMVRGRGGEFLRVQSDTGTIVQYQPGGLIKSLKTSVPILDASGEKRLIPVNDDGSIGDIPYAEFEKGTIIVTDAEDNVVRGWALWKGPKPTLAWQFTPAPGETVMTVTARPSHDPVASIGKALGDRNVLYKYLNPNVILITALGTEASTATFYVLDSASGAVIHSVTHAGVDTNLPIASTISENWFVYSLFSETSSLSQDASEIDPQKVKGYQLVVSELYESPYPNDRGSLATSSNYSSISSTFADDDATYHTPHVLSQTFLIPGPISSISVTSTLQGITTRSLLCVLYDTNAIVSISRAFLDPRRPVGRDATAAEAEEGLFKYSPMLDFEPKWILSHKRELVNMSGIVTSPSLLESTSLVFAFGDVDLFLTRVSPIGAFDLLGKGFSKLQLVLTVVALAVGTTVVAPFVRRKQIDGTWKA